MKKNFIVLIALLAVAAGAFAQNAAVSGNAPEQASATGKWAVGIGFGGTMNIPAVESAFMDHLSYSGYFGGSYGVNVRYNPCQWFGFRLGAQRVAKNYTILRDVVVQSTEESAAEPVQYGTICSNTFWDIPLMVDLSVGRKVRGHLFLGAYAGFWSKTKREGSALPVSTVDGELLFTDTDFDSKRDNRFDAGLNYGLGLSIACFRHVGIDVEALWYYGLTDLQKPYMRELNPMYNTTFLLQLGVNYRF